MFQQPMVKVALKRDRNIERTITKVSYELNKKAYILLEGNVQNQVKKSESHADAEIQTATEAVIQGKKRGRPSKQVNNEG